MKLKGHYKVLSERITVSGSNNTVTTRWWAGNKRLNPLSQLQNVIRCINIFEYFLNTGKGFFGATAELLRRDSSIRQSFSVYAGFTRRFLAPGEVSTAGKGGALQTGQIVLRPKRRGRLS